VAQTLLDKEPYSGHVFVFRAAGAGINMGSKLDASWV
jgi:hypothetical protein